MRALAAGGGLRSALEVCRALRAAQRADVRWSCSATRTRSSSWGRSRSRAQARDAGADGVLCVDYPPDEDAS